MQHNVRLIPSSTDPNPENATVLILGHLEKVPMSQLAVYNPRGLSWLVNNILDDDPTLTPHRCSYCGDRHHLCPLHGDMGCDLQSANDECELCKGENEARKNDDDDAL